MISKKYRVIAVFTIANETPFKAGSNLLFDQFGANIAAVAVKATFAMPENGENAQIIEEQADPLYAESYFDSPNNSGIRYPADIVFAKKNTDIIVNGRVYSKNNKPVRRLRASVQVGGCYKQIEAVGNRYWKKGLFPGFEISKPQLFVKMPITCSRIYGGSDTSKEGESVVFSPNPQGTGFIANKKSVQNTPLPNFEDPGQRISKWKSRPRPATFGCAIPSAEHRIKFAGTYDENWQKTQCPLYPEDLDYRFFNSAQPELIADGFLRGGEPVLLKHLSSSGKIEFRLPAYRIGFSLDLAGEVYYKQGSLYNVVLEPEKKRLYMTWGCGMEIGNQPAKLNNIKAGIENQA